MIADINTWFDLFTPKRVMLLLGFIMLCAFALLMWRAQRSADSKINLDYLFVDSATGTITAAKFATTGAFFASSYVLMYMTATERFSESIFGLYLGAWSGLGAVNIVGQRFGSHPPEHIDDDGAPPRNGDH